MLKIYFFLLFIFLVISRCFLFVISCFVLYLNFSMFYIFNNFFFIVVENKFNFKIVEESFKELYPEKDSGKFVFELNYSGKFSSYNGNVKYGKKIFGCERITFNLSNNWIGIDKEIQKGIIQHLMQKMFKSKIKTINQDLYENFLRNIHIAVPKNHVDLILKECFERVNEKYFLGLVEMPNLVWGSKSFRKLGSYEYGSDKISISKVFENISAKELELLDYVMFHEMLHKVHKFRTKNGRSLHHSRKFKQAEAHFNSEEDIEKKLTVFLRKKRIKNAFGF
jgi:predicted metal-dependent hydrolase